MWVVKFNLSTDNFGERVSGETRENAFLLSNFTGSKERGSYNFTHLLRNYGDK